MDIKYMLKKERALIDRELDRTLPKLAARPKTLHKAMRYSLFSGGKRIRPILTLEACRACGRHTRLALPAACAIEFVHTYSLIHDDLPSMDNDGYRRGKPSCHKKFGEATAILAGDALLTLAFGVLARGCNGARQNRAIDELATKIGSRGMVGGQEADLKERKALTKKKIDFITENKTAALFEASLRLGAISARADRRREGALSRFGRLLGRSFQLIDDYFDNDGYAGIIGREKARKEAFRIAGMAKRELAPFGNKGYALMAITDLIINRKRQ